jgi:hypothetical protein
MRPEAGLLLDLDLGRSTLDVSGMHCCARHADAYSAHHNDI